MSFRHFVLFVFVCLIWGANTVIAKYVINHMGVPPLFYGALRFGVGAILLAPWFRAPPPKPVWRLIVVSLLMGTGAFGLMFVGLKTSAASAAAVVVQLQVPLTALFATLMLGERLDLRRGLGILLTFGGATAVMWGSSGMTFSFGLMLIAGAALCTAVGTVLIKQLVGVKPLQYQAWVCFVSVWPMALATFLTEPGQVGAAVAAGWPFVGVLVFSVLGVAVFAHSVFFWLISRYDASLIATIGLLAPLTSIFIGVVWFHDPFGLRMAFGTAAALLGVVIIVVRRNQLLRALMALRSPRR